MEKEPVFLVKGKRRKILKKKEKKTWVKVIQ